MLLEFQMTEQPLWIVMPILSSPIYTYDAIADCLAQSVPTRLLLINQGVDDAFREELEKIAEEHPDRVLLWSHQPPLPSLAATWNWALDFVWACDGKQALVVNNDVRLHRMTVEGLRNCCDRAAALFVSAVGVTPDDFGLFMEKRADHTPHYDDLLDHPGGPDFSCFLISQECHQQFRFDEHFTPAFCEDLDYHRRLLLSNNGHRIFSVNLPFLHYGSATRATLAGPARLRLDNAISAGSRVYYAQKWGGPVNEETKLIPFGSIGETDGTATTPYLQQQLREQLTAAEIRTIAPVLSEFRDMEDLLNGQVDSRS
jgi:hypothetical protein